MVDADRHRGFHVDGRCNSYDQKIDREMVVEISITTLSLRLILPCAVDREDLFKMLFSERDA